MIAVSAAVAAELARKSGARIFAAGSWTYAYHYPVADAYIPFSLDGYDVCGTYSQDLRIANAVYRARLPYLGAGLQFPTLAIQLGVGADDSEVLWYEQRGLYGRAVVGQSLYVNMGVWESGAPQYTALGYTLNSQAHLVGNPPMLELMGIGGAERLTVARIENDYTAGDGTDGISPAAAAKALLLANGFTTADFSEDSFDAADASLFADECSVIQYAWYARISIYWRTCSSVSRGTARALSTSTATTSCAGTTSGAGNAPRPM